MDKQCLLILNSSPSLSLTYPPHITVLDDLCLQCMLAYTLMNIRPHYVFFICHCRCCRPCCFCCPSVFVYFCVSHPPISMSCYHMDAVDNIKVFFFYYFTLFRQIVDATASAGAGYGTEKISVLLRMVLPFVSPLIYPFVIQQLQCLLYLSIHITYTLIL